MRPLSEAVVNSGVGKKLYCVGGRDKSNGILGDTSTAAVITRIKGRQTGETANNSNNNNPRKGTFSIQNGYGQPLNRYTTIVNLRQTHNYSTMDGNGSLHVKKPAMVNGKEGNNNGHIESYLNESSCIYNNSGLDSDVYSTGSNSMDVSCGSNGLSCAVYTEEDLQEKFHINETPSPTDSLCNSFHSADEEDEHPFFVGMRDIRNPETLKERRIVSSKGTIRGVKNRVKAGIATFLKQGDGIPKKDYRILEKGKIVLYTTSMMIVRDTHEKCKKVKNILQTHMVKYEEHDIFMSRENQKELAERLSDDNVEVPHVFVEGVHLGDATEVERLNENGELRRIFKHFRKISHASSCDVCGGYRYIPCTVCHGSRKSVHRNHFTTEFCALRCIVCDENGLVKCDVCCSEETPSENSNTKL